MIDLLEECQRQLEGVAIATTLLEADRGRLLVFEGITVLGFIVAYSEIAQLLVRWSADANALITDNQLSLRRAHAKAWNTYTVFLTDAAANHAEMVALGAIEEDLTGTRKIARGGVGDVDGVRAALLPLLPIQSAPRLEAVDMVAEIRLRTPELPSRVVDAFLSGAHDALIAKVLEEEP